MDTEERRVKILEMLQSSSTPISGSMLAKELKVSRQIIVGDIAILRAGNNGIIATNNGYIVEKNENAVSTATIKVKHKTEDVYDELCSIIDEGGRVKNLIIEHKAYGQIVIDLNIRSRSDAKAYLERLLDADQLHPLTLNNGVHIHTVEADDMLTLIRVQKTLNEKGYLYK